MNIKKIHDCISSFPEISYEERLLKSYLFLLYTSIRDDLYKIEYEFARNKIGKERYLGGE